MTEETKEKKKMPDVSGEGFEFMMDLMYRQNTSSYLGVKECDLRDVNDKLKASKDLVDAIELLDEHLKAHEKMYTIHELVMAAYSKLKRFEKVLIGELGDKKRRLEEDIERVEKDIEEHKKEYGDRIRIPKGDKKDDDKM